MNKNNKYRERKKKSNTHIKREREENKTKSCWFYFDSLELDREYRRSFFFGDSGALPPLEPPARRPDAGGDCPRR